MPSIELSQDDFDFITEQAALEETSVEDYVSQMVGRQRVIVKYPTKQSPVDVFSSSTLEPPHRKWGM
jgi:hypothetical protein